MNTPVFLRLKACSASTKNDGSMPFGSSVLSSSVSAFRSQNSSNVTTELVNMSTESGNTIIAYISHSTNLIPGLYNINAAVTMTLSGQSTNMTKNYEFDRIYVE